VASSVDDLLAGRQPSTQLRMHKQGKLVVRFETKAAECKSPDRVTADAKSSWLTSWEVLLTHKCTFCFWCMMLGMPRLIMQDQSKQ